jgi:hypothetical protein
MQRRTAATLVEVLVAIFVMGIGLLSILALFPLGAYRMAEAIQQSRCASIAENCDAIDRIWHVRSNSTLWTAPAPSGNDLYLAPPGIPVANIISASSPGPSYPVFIDPSGYLTAAGLPSGGWLVGNQNLFIPRVSVNFVQTGLNSALQWFSFLDDIVFNNTGLPDLTLVGSPYLERDIRYSWAFLCQRPAANNSSVVNLTTVIYNRRPLSMAGNLSLPEYAYGGTGNGTYFDLTRNVVSVDFSATGYSNGTMPPVRPGDWVLDATLDPTFSVPHGYFYRVVAISEVGPTTLELEVQTPFRGFPAGTTIWGNGATQLSSLIVLEGVAEVFERGPGTP